MLNREIEMHTNPAEKKTSPKCLCDIVYATLATKLVSFHTHNYGSCYSFFIVKKKKKNTRFLKCFEE